MFKIRRPRFGKPLGALALWISAGVSLMGACSSSEERQRAVQLAGGCLINSDCAPKLKCAFGRCHKECEQDRDCDHELRCVKNEATGSSVCQLPDETVCKDDEHCPTGQVCAVDLECRDSCAQDADCVGDQVCAASGECASTLPTKGDELDEDGNIVLESVSPGAGDGTGGAGGMSAGAAGTSGTEGGTSSGGNIGQGGSDATAQGGAAGASEEPTSGTGNAAGAPPVSDLDYEETSGGDPVENGTREQAVPIKSSAKLYLTKGDVDWLSYRAPDDGRAHIVTLTLEQDASLSASLEVIAGADRSRIGYTTLGVGTLRQVFFSVGSGTTSYMTFAPTSGVTNGSLRLALEDEPENDEHEPNNEWQEASDIGLGETAEGQLLQPYVLEGDHPQEDWFKVSLALGPATFRLLSVPEEGRIQVIRRDTNGIQASLGVTANAGAVATFDAKASLKADYAGDYWFMIVPYVTTVTSYANFKKPAYFSEQYSFVVTQ